MNRKILIVAALILFAFAVLKQFITSPQSIDENFPKVRRAASPATSAQSQSAYASFLIFTNGTKRDFSEDKYHFRSDAAYLTDANGAIITVEKPRVTWEEFFQSLPAPFQITETCLFTGTGQMFCTNNNQSLKFYLNGKQVTQLLSQPIAPGDQLLISFGNETEVEIEQQIIQIPLPNDDSLPRM